MLSGHAQPPVEYQAAPTTVKPGAMNYGNPFLGPCNAGSTSTAGHGESNATVRRQTGAICSPWCGCPLPVVPGQPLPDCSKTFVECPTSGLPAGTTATPQCMLSLLDPSAPIRSFKPPAYCALVCDPSDPSGTGGAKSRCPKGATCKSLYSASNQSAAKAGIFDTGVCSYDE